MALDEAITNGMADMAIKKVTDTATDLFSFLNPAPCANTERFIDGKVSPCQNAATLVCSSCRLVQVSIVLYCGSYT
jgi:hypothetical protein